MKTYALMGKRNVLQVVLGVAGILIIGFGATKIVAASMPPEVKYGVDTSDVVRSVWNSKLFSDPDAGVPFILWVDDSTLLFAANKDPKPRTHEQMRARIDWLYTWRLGEPPHPVGADPNYAANNGYRAARGSICYHQKALDPATGQASEFLWKGSPGQEREVGPREFRYQEKGVAGNSPRLIEPVDCDFFYADPNMDGQSYVTDSERRFYLVYGTTRTSPHTKGPIELMRADGGDRTTLPFGGTATFRLFDKVFYIWQRSTTDSLVAEQARAPSFKEWQETNCWAVWRVEPESRKTEKLCIPFGKWGGDSSSGTMELLPAKVGLFFSYRLAKGESGLFKLEGRSVRKIVQGRIEAAVVSPNGCRIAFQHIPSSTAFEMTSPVSSTIAAIDICRTNE